MKDYPLYIALDGIDGCGKTTLAQGMYLEMTRMKRRVKLTREPGGDGGRDVSAQASGESAVCT